MSNIEVRNGKVQAGLYTCGKYVIEKQRNGWWFIWENFSNEQKKLVQQSSIFTNAYNWCRRNP